MSSLKFEEEARPSIVYEENMPVIVRRRGVTMTVRIFGAEDDIVSTKRMARQRSWHDTHVKKMAEHKSRIWKSDGSLVDVRRSGSCQSEETPGSSLSASPSSPDKLTKLLPESPTRGLGQWSKGRSSSIATTATPHILVPIRWNFRPRRFSVDSQFSRQRSQRLLKMFLKDKKVEHCTPSASPIISPSRRSVDHTRFCSATHRLSRELTINQSTRSLNTASGKTGRSCHPSLPRQSPQ